MANRRMFSKEVVRSDRFTEMSSDAQSLYFHLGMEADDDGFVTPKGVMRLINAPEDALRVLIAKQFVIPFDSGVVVVKDWKENNFLRSDRYKPTQYQKEMAQLSQDNGRYTIGIPNDNQWSTQDRIGKDRILGVAVAPQYEIVKEEETQPKVSKSKYPNSKTVFSWFPKPQRSWLLNTTELKHAELLFDRGERQVRAALEFAQENLDDEFCPQVTKPSDLERKWVQLLAYKKKKGL